MKFGDIGVDRGMLVPQGVKSISTEESRANASYGTLTTPDQVAGVELPVEGLLMVVFQALWRETVNGAARAAIFIGGNQVKIAEESGGAPAVQEASIGAGVTNYRTLATSGASNSTPGLTSSQSGVSGDETQVTTGQIVGFRTINSRGGGGPLLIFADAGTHTISVRFRTSSGSVFVKQRRLWVASAEFPSA